MTWLTRRALRGLIMMVALLGASSLSMASKFIRADVPTLRQMSESVVHARTIRMESAWGAEGRMIYTYVTLRVIKTLHGTPSDEIIVRVPGGTVDGYTVKMDGAPEFRVGQAVVAFISQWNDGTPMVAGYFQGLSTVVRDSAGNQVLQGGAANGRSIRQLAKQLARGGDEQ